MFTEGKITALLVSVTTAIPPRSAQLKTYDATDNGDGTVTIHDLELVGAMKKGERGSKGNGRAWMERVIATHLSQLVSGYVAPAHDGHHGVFEKPPLGTFVPMRVRDVEYEGETLPVLFGDVTVEQSTLAAIQAGSWPYRSIEVDWDADHITSLAFLSGSAPHWRFPILKSVRVLNAAAPVSSTLTEAAMTAVPPSPRAAGFRDAPTHLRARSLARLEAFGEGDDEKPDAKPKPGEAKEETTLGEDGLPVEAPAPKWAASLMAACQKILEAVVGKKTDSAADPVHDESPETSGDEIEAKEAQDEADESAEEDDDEEKNKKEKAQMAATTTTLDAATQTKLDALTARVTSLESTNTTLAAENATLKAENAAAKLAAQVADFVKTGEARLRAKRVAVPANFGDSIAKLYAAGEEAAETFVATLETSGRQDPPENLTAALSATGNVAPDAPEFSAFVNGSDNPAARLEACRKIAGEHRAMVARFGADKTASLHTMLAAHFRDKTTAK